jgi:hypothetical protein
MTLNPYEPPQTIDTRPPVAEEVLVTTIDFAALAEAAKGCAAAGKYYAFAFGLTAAAILGGALLPEEIFKSFWGLLLFTPFLVSLGILGVGVFWNTIACSQFKFELPDPKLRRLYASCQRASWLKYVLGLAMAFVPVASGHRSNLLLTIWDVLWFFVPAVIMLFNSVVTVVLHFRGINELGELIQTKTADKFATLYLFSGLPATLVVVIIFLVLRVERHHLWPPLTIFALVPLLLLPVFVAYYFAYRRLGAAFRLKAGKQ